MRRRRRDKRALVAPVTPAADALIEQSEQRLQEAVQARQAQEEKLSRDKATASKVEERNDLRHVFIGLLQAEYQEGNQA